MLVRLFQGSLLLAATVGIHAVVLSAMLNRFHRRYSNTAALSFSAYSWLLMRIATFTVLAHLLEIAVWAMFYAWKEALPSLEASFYFSSVTYATIGYGDLVLPETWRLIGAMEGLTGILMCGWSGAFFFAVVSNLYARTQTSH